MIFAWTGDLNCSKISSIRVPRPNYANWISRKEMMHDYSLLRFLVLLTREQNNPVLGGGPISMGAWFLCVIFIWERKKKGESNSHTVDFWWSLLRLTLVHELLKHGDLQNVYHFNNFKIWKASDEDTQVRHIPYLGVLMQNKTQLKWF